jgi:hypothetical protein
MSYDMIREWIDIILKVKIMKVLQDLSELNTLTKEELKQVSLKLFRKGLTGDKSNFVRVLRREFDFYGDKKYNLILLNMVLSGNIKEYTNQEIKSDEIIMLKHLPIFEQFLYKFHLGYNKLYEDKKEDIECYTVEYDYLFNDQFNTDKKRILERDYAVVFPSTGFKKLTDLRNNTLRCGYCGKQYTENTKDGYCHSCTGSEYLLESDYKLLQLFPISQGYKNKVYRKIPQALLDEIREKQKETKIKKAQEQIKANTKIIEKKIKEINQESDILTYLIENDDFILLHDIYIFYSHSQTLDFTYKADKMTDTLKELVLKHKDILEDQFKITVKV